MDESEPTSWSSAPGRSAAGRPRSLPRRVPAGSSWSSVAWPVRVQAVAPPASSGHRAGRRPPWRSGAGRSTSIARQQARYGTDSGFRELGYLIIAITARDERDGRARVAMQRAEGLPVRWLTASEACAVNPTLSPDGHRGGSYLDSDGAIDPPRNVRAYSLAMAAAGVELRERTAVTGVRILRGRVVGVDTTAGPIDAGQVLLTGGPSLRDVGRLAGLRIPAGAVRHQVAVTEPAPAFDVERQPMVFDLARGLYWRLEEGGLLFGMSNPAEPPGPAREIDWPYLRRMRRRLDAARPGRARPRPAPSLGSDDRLHPGSPADPRTRTAAEWQTGSTACGSRRRAVTG